MACLPAIKFLLGFAALSTAAPTRQNTAATQTIKLKVLTPLAKDGRGEDPDAFTQFNVISYVGAPPPPAPESQGPRIAEFRAQGKSEADVQAEYARARNQHRSTSRSNARAEKRQRCRDADRLESEQHNAAVYKMLQERMEQRLKGALDKGLITHEEYDAKKAEFLAAL